MTDVRATWNRIAAWLGGHAPECLAELEPPVPAADLDAAAGICGDLPPDYVELLQIHNGVDKADYGSGVFGGFALHSLRGALAARDVWRGVHVDLTREYDLDSNMKVPPGVHRAWWHEGWLPIAVHADDSRTTIFMDLDPASGGIRGQLVRHVVEDERLMLVSASVGAWLAQIASAMEAGQVSVARDGDELVGLDWQFA